MSSQVDNTRTYFLAALNDADGSQSAIGDVRAAPRFDPLYRRLRGGTIELDMGWGTTRILAVEPLSDTGFPSDRPATSRFKGKAHGSRLGDDFLDGERCDDTSDLETARIVHQLRDCPVRVREEDAEGFGIVETILTGAHPRYGLDAAPSFL